MWPQYLGIVRLGRSSGVASEAQHTVAGPGVHVPSNHGRIIGLNHSTRKQTYVNTEWKRQQGFWEANEKPPSPEAYAFLSPVEANQQRSMLRLEF